MIHHLLGTTQLNALGIREAQDAKKSIVTAPYIGSGATGLMISFAAPVNGGAGGVVGSDVFLTKIVEQIMTIKLAAAAMPSCLIKAAKFWPPSRQDFMKNEPQTADLATDKLAKQLNEGSMANWRLDGKANFLLLQKFRIRYLSQQSLINQRREALDHCGADLCRRLVAGISRVVTLDDFVGGAFCCRLVHVPRCDDRNRRGGGGFEPTHSVDSEDGGAQPMRLISSCRSNSGP